MIASRGRFQSSRERDWFQTERIKKREDEPPDGGSRTSSEKEKPAVLRAVTGNASPGRAEAARPSRGRCRCRPATPAVAARRADRLRVRRVGRLREMRRRPGGRLGSRGWASVCQTWRERFAATSIARVAVGPNELQRPPRRRRQAVRERPVRAALSLCALAARHRKKK